MFFFFDRFLLSLSPLIYPDDQSESEKLSVDVYCFELRADSERWRRWCYSRICWVVVVVLIVESHLEDRKGSIQC